MHQILLLLAAFFHIGLFSIGGGYAIIPLIQEQVVDKYGWVSQKIFTDIITISQMTPGPLAVNTSTFVGLQIAGIPGALAATFGCVVSGVLLSAFMYRFFCSHMGSASVFQVLKGLKAASLGLIISAAATILLLTFTGSSQWNQISSADWAAVVLFLVSLAALRRYKWNPIFIMIITGLIGLVIYGLFPFGA